MNGAALGSTIFALATPAGRGAVAVIRLSGPGAAKALTSLCDRTPPTPRHAALRKLRGPNGEMVDEALVLWMPGPGSFTGEDCVELHLHGGRAVVAAVSELLMEAGLRPAEPGEFTRRAFEHGRLDLTQAEAIGDLVEAESGGQRRQALAQLDGALSRRYEAWREGLLDALALLEADIDFPDEDVPGTITTAARTGLQQTLSELQAAIADQRGERVREGFRIAIVGAPNVGKSSLLNAVAGRDAAIVTAIAGTTRDVVEVPISFAGQTLVLADTAGLRATEDLIEAEGVRRAHAWSSDADLRIGVVDLTRLETLDDVVGLLREGDLIVLNKADRTSSRVALSLPPKIKAVTAAAGRNEIGELRQALAEWFDERAGSQAFPATTRSRHRALLQEAADHLGRSVEEPTNGSECTAEDVRLAIRALERITGRSDPEAVLDRVFASFCIGK